MQGEERNSHSVDNEEYSKESWEKCWKSGATEWHEQDVNR